MYLNKTAAEIIGDLLENFVYEKVMNDDSVNEKISYTPASGVWGVDTYEVIEAEFIDESERKINFEATCTVSCSVSEDSVKFLDSFNADITGTAELDNDNWEITKSEVVAQEFDDYIQQDQMREFIARIEANIDYYQTFQEEIENLKELSAINLAPPLQKMLYRQIYIGVITCLETYLLDALVQQAIATDENKRRFAEKYEFKNSRVEVKNVYEFLKNIEEKIKNELADLIYHNVRKISAIYKAVLRVDFSPSEQLYTAIGVRHDLVHRNGKTKDGKFHKLTKLDVEKVMVEVERLVTEIQMQIDPEPMF